MISQSIHTVLGHRPQQSNIHMNIAKKIYIQVEASVYKICFGHSAQLPKKE
jgi:hypothetical protein